MICGKEDAIFTLKTQTLNDSKSTPHLCVRSCCLNAVIKHEVLTERRIHWEQEAEGVIGQQDSRSSLFVI